MIASLIERYGEIVSASRRLAGTALHRATSDGWYSDQALLELYGKGDDRHRWAQDARRWAQKAEVLSNDIKDYQKAIGQFLGKAEAHPDLSSVFTEMALEYSEDANMKSHALEYVKGLISRCLGACEGEPHDRKREPYQRVCDYQIERANWCELRVEHLASHLKSS